MLMSLPISITKVLTCKTCGCKCNDASPLKGASKADKYGGFRPWGKYRRTKDGAAGRRPEGFFCLICTNTYRCLPEHLSVGGG